VKTAGSAGYEASARSEVLLSRSFRLGLWLYRRFGLTGPLGRRVADRFEALLASGLVVRELRRFNRESVAPLLGAKTSSALGDLLGSRLQMIEDALAAVELQFPAFAESLRLQYLARAGLRLEDADYRWVSELIVEQAGRYANGRIVSALEGGYEYNSLAHCVELHLRALMGLHG